MTSPEMIGSYRPGSSVLHRIPAGPKLLALMIALVGITVVRSWWTLGAGAALVLVLAVLGRIPVRSMLAQVWPLRWFLIVAGGLQWWLVGWRAALTMAVTLILCVALAGVFTLTTKVSAMLDLCVRVLHPLRRFVDPDRVGLGLALTIRAIPLMTAVVGEVQQARKARGVGFSIRAIAVPVVVRSLRHADALGDALVARGADD